MARDLCNGAKHRVIDRPSVDATPWIVRQYRPTDGVRLVVKAGELYDLVALAGACMDAWDRFLTQASLDGWGPSAAAVTLGEAMRGRER